jgi:putative oxidoreductase
VSAKATITTAELASDVSAALARPYPSPAPELMAFAAAAAEIVLPVLLVLGLGTRFAATGLLIMTIVVQLTVPAGWPLHVTWAAMALGIMAWGPGKVSLDYLLTRLAAEHQPGVNGSVR